MFSKSALTRGVQHSLRRPVLQASQRRCFAAATATPGSGSYETTDVGGLKVVSKDTHGPTTKVAVVVKAGTRYEPCPGLTVGLEEFAFKSTTRRSALRIHRESELLGSQLKAYHTREALVLEASFLRADLPYFTELLAEVLSCTRYTTHEFHEEISPVLPIKQTKYSADVTALALDAAHAAAFHSGLGAPLYPSPSTPLSAVDEHSIADFAEAVYTKSSLALVTDGASKEAMANWAEKFFAEVPASSKAAPNSIASKYYGGDQRFHSTYGSAIAIAFPSDVAKPEFDVLAALLGGQSSISWSPGFTLLSKANLSAPAIASNLKYSDAGLFTIQVTGSDLGLKAAAEGAVGVLKAVAEGVDKEALTKAVAKAKFDTLEASQNRTATMVTAGLGALGSKTADVSATIKSLESVTADQVKAAAKSLLGSKASVGAVGDLYALPYATDIGLNA